jgi:hypothetical protein
MHAHKLFSVPTASNGHVGIVVSIWLPIPGRGDSLVPLAGDTPVNGFAMEGKGFMWSLVQAGVSPAGGTRLSPLPGRCRISTFKFRVSSFEFQISSLKFPHSIIPFTPRQKSVKVVLY